MKKQATPINLAYVTLGQGFNSVLDSEEGEREKERDSGGSEKKESHFRGNGIKWRADHK